MNDDNNIQDLPPQQNEQLKNTMALNKIKAMGDRYGQGEAWANAAQQTSQQNGIPLWWIQKTVDRENASWNPAQRSSDPHSSATGLGQFIHSTAYQLGVNPTDPVSSLQGIGTYLGQLRNQIGSNDFSDVTHAYVLGPGGYKQYTQTGSAPGSDQIPNVDKFLANEQLLNEGAPMNPNFSEVGAMSASRVAPTNYENLMALEKQGALVHLAENNEDQLHQSEDQYLQQPTHNLGALSELQNLSEIS